VTVTDAAPAPSQTERPKTDWWQRRYTFTGTAVGFLFMLLSMTPSLLPRGPLFQGIVSGAAGAIGYMLGVFGVWLVRFMRSRPSSPPAPRWAWPVLVGLGALGLVLGIVYFHYWQDHVRDLFGVDRLKWYEYIQAGVLAVVLLFVFIEFGQLIGRLVRFLVRQLSRVAPPRVSFVVTLITVLAVFIAVLNGVVVRGAMSVMNKTFSNVNDELDPKHPAPTSALRSGGPGSQVSWSSLGHQGRIFVGNGPTVAQLSEFNKAPATEPIRAYAGVNSANGIRATAQLAADELERKGGLKRKLIGVATTTGTGWVNAAEADSLEYMFNGDTALVSMQYSYLPSWLSFLVDKENARQAGEALFEAVDEKVRALPEAQRPKIVVFGESLGSFGGEAPFLRPNNIIARTDGALFSGPTFNNTMRDFVTDNRDPGSPEWLPIFDDGANVRFAARADNLGRPDKPWGNPRIAYLQHASDPIAWWTPELLFAQPDWLREPRGYDVSKDMNWIPVVTFLQVAADMAVAVDVPDGHGHHYVKDVVNAWAGVLQPPGWTPDKTERLRGRVNQDYPQ
jgi:uncharacterized membrane protein